MLTVHYKVMFCLHAKAVLESHAHVEVCKIVFTLDHDCKHFLAKGTSLQVYLAVLQCRTTLSIRTQL